MWNLFDILSILSDSEQCDPALLFWLVEELLDSQTIAGCRKVFDFLESRRERITAKHFKQKQLVILRTCNELLRRLSRALDPAFCGRVFIFMFQCFPLGDKSSVNLRGEYHVENVTTYDHEPTNSDGNTDKMDVDADEKMPIKNGDGKKQSQTEKPLGPDALYPTFWSLQESFNQPKKLFDPTHFASFRAGLEATMATFRSIKPEPASRSKERLDRQVEENKGSLKRKRDDDDDDDELAGAFNPKYLTSRDLFKLEVSSSLVFHCLSSSNGVQDKRSCVPQEYTRTGSHRHGVSTRALHQGKREARKHQGAEQVGDLFRPAAQRGGHEVGDGYEEVDSRVPQAGRRRSLLLSDGRDGALA